MSYVAALLCAGIGILAVIAGEADDSPGLGGIGLLLILGAVVVVYRRMRRRA